MQVHGTSLDLKQSMDKFKDSIRGHSSVPMQVTFHLNKCLKNKDDLRGVNLSLFISIFHKDQTSTLRNARQ